MANELLQFKMGEHGNLASAGIKAGTVYVTTDEKAMYVDISDTSRIRLGGVTIYESVKQLTEYTKPPYDSGALYYLTGPKALVMWDASANEGAGAWHHINSTSSVEALVTALDGRVTKAEEDISKNAADILVNAGAITANAEAIATNAADIKTINEVTIPALETEIGKKADQTALEALSKTVSANETDIEDKLSQTNTNVTTLTGRVDTLATNSATKEELKTAKEGLEGQISTVSGNLATLTGRVGTAEGEITKLKDKDTELAGNIATNASDIATINGEITAIKGSYATTSYVDGKASEITQSVETLSGTVNGINGRVVTAEADIKDLQAKDITLNSAIEKNAADIKTANDNIATIQTTYATKTYVDNKETAINNTINTLEGKVNGIGDRVTATETAIGAEDTSGTILYRIKAIEGVNATQSSDITTLNGTTADHKTRIETLEGKMATAEEDIETLEGTVQDLVDMVGGTTTAELQKDIDALEGRMDTAESGVSTNASNIQKNAEAISTLNTATIPGINTEISGLKDRLSPVETDLGTAKSDISGLKAKMGTAETNITNLQNGLATANTNITNLTNDKADVTYVDQEIEDLGKELGAELADHIKAANAMRYKGTVGSETALGQITEAEVGDTYVVSTAFSTYHAGDLLIATGTENASGKLDTITWEVVDTGYIETHNPKLGVDGTKLELSSYPSPNSGDLGSIEIKAQADTNIRVTNDQGAIQIGMVWGSF